MERSEGDMSLKNPVTPPGIDPGTVRLVAQRLNHYTTPGLQSEYTSFYVTMKLTDDGHNSLPKHVAVNKQMNVQISTVLCCSERENRH
jgi:hypothetical protein